MLRTTRPGRFAARLTNRNAARLDVSAQLAASRTDLVALSLANLHRELSCFENASKPRDRFTARRSIIQSGDRIVRNHIQQRAAAFQQFNKLLRMLRSIVDVGEQHILKGQSSMRDVKVSIGGIQNRLQTGTAVDRHKPTTKLIIRRVKRNG